MIIVEPSYEILTTLSSMEILKQIELAARTCYKTLPQSEDLTREFVRKLIKRKHFAMLEFGPAIAVKFICDRGVANEIITHRLFSKAQESTRYCDYNKKGQIEVICPFYKNGIEYIQWIDAITLCENIYNRLRSLEVSPQIARSVLPLCLKTELIIQGNIREWRHFFTLRTVSAAHPQMRELAIPLLQELQSKVEIVFEDIIYE